MSRNFQAQRLNLQELAQDGQPWSETTLVKDLPRLAAEAQDVSPADAVQWQVRGELRPQAGAEEQVWLHLAAQASVPLTCQRCMTSVASPLEIDQWYRFVESEEIAMAEDDEAEEDLLVMAPQFDLLGLLEDELLMALPLVPMHETCPVTPVFSAGDPMVEAAEAKPNPFAVLGQLKKS
jgi:uncharacterized protein